MQPQQRQGPGGEILLPAVTVGHQGAPQSSSEMSLQAGNLCGGLSLGS